MAGRSDGSRRGSPAGVGDGRRRGRLLELEALGQPQHLVGVEDLAREQLVGDLQQHGLLLGQNARARS